MSTLQNLLNELASQLRSKPAVSFYINGGPGTGKSTLLGKLGQTLPDELPRCFMIHNRINKPEDARTLVRRQMEICQAAGFLDDLPPEALGNDIAGAWQWFRENTTASSHQIFAILVDLQSPALDISLLAGLFSSARYLETAWRPHGPSILYLFAGMWRHRALEQHFHDIETSFPYSHALNYRIWTGIDTPETVAWLRDRHPRALSVYGEAIHDVVGGNPAAVKEIMESFTPDRVGVPELLLAVREAAQNGSLASRTVALWPTLLPESRSLVQNLVVHMCQRDPGPTPWVEELIALGIIGRREIGSERLLAFRSWYMFLVFRQHLEAIGLGDHRIAQVPVAELSPDLSSVTSEAYRLICDLELSVRNFVTTVLASEKADGDGHFLADKLPEYDADNDRVEHALERVLGWKRKSLNAGLPADMNPLVSFLSTRDLAALVQRAAAQSRNPSWSEIAQAVRDLADVRDAIMHHQVIDDASLRRLYELQTTVYVAMAQMGL